MTPSRAVFERLLVLLGRDTETFNTTSGSADKICLAMAPFTPGPNLLIGGVTEATFTGYAAREVATGTQPQSNDPATADSLLTFNPDPLPYNWEVTGGTGLPQTIYGFYLTDGGKTILYASALLPDPIILSAVNDFIGISTPQLRQLNGSIV